jgi:hypothetical protein
VRGRRKARDHLEGNAVTDRELYWWKMPDDEGRLMALKPAELRCYLVVARAIQQDRNKGRISERQVAIRARVSLRHTHSALGKLVESGWLERAGKAGATATFVFPHGWKGPNCIPTGKQLKGHADPNCSPTGEQFGGDLSAEGEQHCAPTGEQNCFPTGKQHLDLIDPSEPSSSSTRRFGRFVDPVDAGPATTTSEYLNGKGQLEPWPWTDGDRDQAREAMRAHFGALMLPDLDLTREVLAHMQGLDDVRLWLWDLTERRVKRRGWGFYPCDAQKWPRRRADVQGQVDAQRAVMEAEARAAAEANAAAEREAEAAMKVYEQEQRAQQEFIAAAEAQGWLQDSESMCSYCYGFGRRDVETGAICDCSSGRNLRLKIEQDRARVRNNSAAPKQTEPPTRGPRPIREPQRRRHGARRVNQ